MKLIAPDYYPAFSCIADRCRHSCCVGWEIDVDPDSLARYQQLDGPLGQELRDKIVLEEDCAHFRLGEDERCPFLNERGLCRMILGLGEDSLCQICTDHPRYRNYFCDREELGLGLCCEAAGALILSREAPMSLVTLEDDGAPEETDEFEDLLTQVRSRALAIVQDRSLTVEARMDRLLDEFQITMPDRTPAEWAEVYLSLEQMDGAWAPELEKLKQPAPSCRLARFETAFEQLLVYFLYRHLSSAQDETDFPAYLAFAVLSCRVVRQLCARTPNCTFEDLVELARLYSSEVEYDEDNTDALIQLLWEVNN